MITPEEKRAIELDVLMAYATRSKMLSAESNKIMAAWAKQWYENEYCVNEITHYEDTERPVMMIAEPTPNQ